MKLKNQIIRLDQFVAKAAQVTRSQAKKLIAQKRIQRICDNQVEILLDAKHKVAVSSSILFDNQPLSLQTKQYFILNKPKGYICSTQDEVHPSALNLLGVTSANLHFAGRLDADTTGLVLISDDGQWTHKITSPRKKCKKTYLVDCADEISRSQIVALEQGVELKDEPNKTQPASIKLVSAKQIELTITEGRYHQVKRMLAAVGNHVEQLHRQQIAQISLNGLAVGEWRDLTQAEINLFE